MTLSIQVSTWHLTLGPLDFRLTFSPSFPINAFGSNPRCFIRSLNFDGYDEYNSHPASHDYEPPSVGGLGLHGGGHATTGLALEDFFASPADPAFMLFRGQVDRLWTLWRGKDEAHCRYAVNGSSAIWYGPQTPDVTMDTYVDFGVMGDSRQMVKMMSPTQNGHYYQYE
ncbi:hypothetical protein N7463_008526 [Penicillium fimorum]|uniref:Tyrosinase copper-binding domain-containing protein n=1 Tax=Penicillium fimorum TaxID=1882269 RepID=A0A9X0C3W0_9EURO|nr:hypothetical protein N7463_008526 [Penicillium fimorum]